MNLSQVIQTLEDLAPPRLSETWDNTGLLLGDRQQSVSRVLTCLTLTPDVAAEAVAAGVQLVVTHHPLMFKPIQRVTTDTSEGRTLWRLATQGIAVYSPHTAWDSAPQGINQQLAEGLGLSEIQPLRPLPDETQVKLVTFVPESDLERVQTALWDVGCGRIGAYERCSFYSAGTGTFYGTEGTDPTVGQAGRLERAPEFKLEVVCPKRRIAAAVTALRAAHSYEEPALDVVPLEMLTGTQGTGRWGSLGLPTTLQQFLEQVRSLLPGALLQVVGNPDLSVQRVAVTCGSAAEFWKDARKLGCQVLLTGESRFHTGLEVRDAGMGLIVAGHYATEHFAMERLAQLLSQHCPALTVTASTAESDPFRAA